MREFDPNKIYSNLIASGNDWADKEAAASLLEESRKTVLADLINQCQESSMAAREQRALGDERYKTHITRMVEARREATKARVNYDAQKVLGELRRTEQSNLRAEMNLR